MCLPHSQEAAERIRLRDENARLRGVCEIVCACDLAKPYDCQLAVARARQIIEKKVES